MGTDVAKREPTTLLDVNDRLAHAKDWLREATRLDDVAASLPQAELYRQLVTKRELGKEAEAAAAELVWRVNRRLGELWVMARENGHTITNADAGKMSHGGAPSAGDGAVKLRALDVFGSDQERTDSLVMARANEDDFADAIATVRESGNLSRAALVRTLKGGPAKVKNTSEWHHRKRKLDPVRIVTESLAALQGIASGLALIQPEDVTDTARREWARDMRTALQEIERFRKGLARP